MKAQLYEAAIQCDLLAQSHRSMAAKMYAKSRYLEKKGIVKRSVIRAAAKHHLIKATHLSRHYERLMGHYSKYRVGE